MSLDPILTRRRAARVLAAPRLPRPLLRALLVLVVVAVVLGGGWLVLRDSSLAAVRDVEVIGSTSSEEGRIRAALESAALDMTTLHVREDALRAAAAPYASVADLRISTDFPHGMRIEVVEHRPVAVLELDGRQVAAAGSGLVLRGVAADRDLPAIRVDAMPTGERVTNGNTRAALAIAAAAPELLRRRVLDVWTGPRGMMLSLEDGPDLIFGSAADAARKWTAAARVLADSHASGATYLDLRIPERVAAGGLGPVAEETPQPTPQVDPQP
jgi:cell division protein FtsQ